MRGSPKTTHRSIPQSTDGTTILQGLLIRGKPVLTKE